MAHPLTDTPLCRIGEIEDGQGRAFVLGEGAEALAVFVVRSGQLAFAYVNACPHLGTPLDWGSFDGTGGRFVSADSGNILCATHGAEFRIEDGFCVHGPCRGQSLVPVPVSVRDGDVVLG